MILLMLAAAAAPSPSMPLPRSDQGQARTIVERQLVSPPRAGPSGGVSAEEADMIMQHYLSSIGKPVRTDTGSSATSQPQP